MNRLETTLSRLKAAKRKAFITFTMAGDPDADTALAILQELAKSADILEIGMPFTDPMADGPVIQAAGLRALKNGIGIRETFLLIEKFRSKNLDTPIVLMGYTNPVLSYGVDNFINKSKELGVDGFIFVDLPPEEAKEFSAKAQQKNLSLIRLLTPTTDEKRLPKILEGASGFLYYVSVAGVTGTASADPKKAGAHIAALKRQTDLPIMAGFGIRTAEDAAAMAQIADGIVVGSAFVQTVADFAIKTDLPQKLGTQATALAHAIK